jgi:hypothetical protein
VAKVKGATVRNVHAGERVVLDGSASTDPDKNTLSFSWWQYYEADNATTKLAVKNNTVKSASFIVPNEPGKQLHVILQVTDNGEPMLTSYKRIIFNITK